MDLKVPPETSCCSGEDWCAVVCASQVLHGKWHLVIVERLLDTPTARFSELERGVAGISGKVLSECLQHLKTEGIVVRTDEPQGTSGAYTLTDKGRDLRPVVEALRAWGARYLEAATGRRPPR